MLTLVAALAGAVVGFVGALVLQSRNQGWQLKRERFANQLQVVVPLDEALVQTQLIITDGRSTASGPDWQAAHDEWETGWVRLTPRLHEAEIESRYDTVGAVLKDLMLSDLQPQRGSAVKVVMRAISNARIALAYWGRDERLPERSFPSPEEVIQLLGQGDPQPYSPDAPLQRWLKEHEQPGWR